ncbi:MAG: hypothetical protein U0452_05365 [Anaerolineae bacterium]
MATAITGYPTISVYEEFTPDPSQARTGSLMQWSYDEMGIVTFSTELWNPELAAGIEHPAFYQVRGRSREDELKLLAYNDEHLGGKGFVNWTPFDHPQPGPVEIGGWTHMYTFRNCRSAPVRHQRQGARFPARDHPQQLHLHAAPCRLHAAAAHRQHRSRSGRR